MPKKKLTKAQVKRKLKTCMNAMYDMILDRMIPQGNSDVPVSFMIGSRIINRSSSLSVDLAHSTQASFESRATYDANTK